MAFVPLIGGAIMVKALEGMFGGDNGRSERYEAQIVQLQRETAEKVEKARKEAVEEHEQAKIEKREKYPRPWYLPNDNLPTIGVIGESGVGKSTFINTVLGKKMSQVGIGEQTKGPMKYLWGDVRLVDLPGACTKNFKAEDYFQTFGIRYYDAIVILSSDPRVKELGTDAVDHLHRNGIPTMFVLSKVDSLVTGAQYLDQEGDTGEDMSEGEVLDKADKLFTERLALYSCDVYLISCLEVRKECGGLAAVAAREMPLQRRINKDWQPLLHNMRAYAIDRKQATLKNQ